jgi:recombination protein RecT
MTNEIVKKEKQDIAAAFVEQIKNGWNNVLPAVCTPERFARVALTCLKKDGKLLAAIQTQEGRASIAAAFMKCAELGIEPDGRRAYLIPYKNDIQLIIDYKGIAELAMRSGYVSNIHADKVCENDEFVYNIGVIEKHRINFREDRGKPYAYYAIVTFKDGTKKCEVMNKDEIDAIRKRSKASNSGPWVTDYDEMAKKTVFKRLSKWVPQSPELREAVDFDNRDYTVPAPQPAPQADIDYTPLELEPIEPKTETASEAQPKDGLEEALSQQWEDTIPA